MQQWQQVTQQQLQAVQWWLCLSGGASSAGKTVAGLLLLLLRCTHNCWRVEKRWEVRESKGRGMRGRQSGMEAEREGWKPERRRQLQQQQWEHTRKATLGCLGKRREGLQVARLAPKVLPGRTEDH